MKARYLILIALLIPNLLLSEPLATDVEINTYWVAKDWTNLEAAFDAHVAVSEPDVAMLYCAKIFFTFVRPDRDKAVAAATKLLNAAHANGNQGFVDLATLELNELEAIPEVEFAAPGPGEADAFHAESPDTFPSMSLAIKLRTYTAP